MKKAIILMAAMALAFSVAQGMGAKPVLSETPDAKATATAEFFSEFDLKPAA